MYLQITGIALGIGIPMKIPDIPINSQTCLCGHLYQGIICHMQPPLLGPLNQNTVQMNCIKGSHVSSSHFLSFPWMNP